MANMWVPSLAPGQRSLPAGMRTQPGAYFAQRRMANGVAGLFGLGQDDSDEYTGDSDDDTGDLDDTSTGGNDTIDPGIVIPVAGDTVAGGPGYFTGNTVIPVAGDTVAGGPAYTALTNAGVTSSAAVALLNTPGVTQVAGPNAKCWGGSEWVSVGHSD